PSRRRENGPGQPASSCTPVLKFQAELGPTIGLGGHQDRGVVGLAGALALAVLEAGAAVPQQLIHHLPSRALPEAVKKGVILPDHKAALAACAEKALFPLGYLRAAVRASSNHGCARRGL